MSTALPSNRLGSPPSVEALPVGGPIAQSTTALVAGHVYVSAWLDVAAWVSLRLQALIATFGGTITIDWSLDKFGVHVAGVPAAVVAGALYDSGPLPVIMQYARVTYTQSAGGPSGALLIDLLAAAAGGGTATVNFTTDPDGSIQTRARVLTDEGTFDADFSGGSYYTAIVGNVTLISGSKVWSRAAATTPLKVGDYLELVADNNPAAPVMAQIDTIALDGLSGTLRAGYNGLGGTGAAHVSEWIVGCTANAGDSNLVAGIPPLAVLTVGAVSGSRAWLAHQLGAGGRKGSAPIWTRFLVSQNFARAFCDTIVGLVSDLGSLLVMRQLAVMGWSGVPEQIQELTGLDFTVGFYAATLITMPNGTTTVDGHPHLFEVEQFEDQVNYYIDGVRQSFYPVGEANQAVIPKPYQNLYVLVQIENTGPTAGSTALTLIDAHAKSLDVVDVRPVQPDAAKLRVTAELDGVATANPPSGVGAQATLAGDASALVAKGMVIGRWYLLTIIGGDPVVLNFAHGAANRLTCSTWYAGTKFKFKAIAVDLAAQKFTAGSTSPTFCVEPLDGGTVVAGP